MGQCEMIRQATGADVPAMVRMAGDFIAASGTGLPFDAEYVESSLRIHLGTGGRFTVVLDVDGEARGMLCAMASRSTLAPVAVATELVFWIDPECRGRAAMEMIQAYSDWAQAAGCMSAAMVSLPGRSLERLYSMAGFAPAETTHSKVF